MFIHPSVPSAQPLDGILYNGFMDILKPAGSKAPVIYSIIAFFLLYFQAMGINKVLNDQRLLPKPNYLAAMSYLLFTSVFREWSVLSAPLIINTLLIWVLARSCTIYNNPNAKTQLFNIGMLAGLSSLFYFPAIAFSILIFVAIIITRPFSLQEWVVALLGILTPYYFEASWLFLSGRWKSFSLPAVSVNVPIFHETLFASIAIAIILIIILTGMVFAQNNMRRLVVQSRKSWSLIYLYLAVSILVPFLNSTHNFDYWILTAVPAAAFGGAAFLYPERKWFSLLFHWSLVILTFILGFFVR